MQDNKYEKAYIGLPLKSNLFEMIENHPENKLLLEALEKAGFSVMLEEDYLFISASHSKLSRGAGAKVKTTFLKDSEKLLHMGDVLNMLEKMSEQEIMDSILIRDKEFELKPISRATYYRRKKRMMEYLDRYGDRAKTFCF